MALSDFLDRLTLTRRFVKAVERIADAQEIQCVLFERLANQVAPVQPTASPDELRTTGPAFVLEAQQARYQEWALVFEDRTGRSPTEAEVEEWFADDEARV